MPSWTFRCCGSLFRLQHSGWWAWVEVEWRWETARGNARTVLKAPQFVLLDEVCYILTFLTLSPGWAGRYTCWALRPYQFGPMCIPECNHKVTGNGYEAMTAVKLKSACKAKNYTWALVKNRMSVLWKFGQHFVGCYPTDFRNLSGHWSTNLHYHVKVANHGGGVCCHSNDIFVSLLLLFYVMHLRCHFCDISHVQWWVLPNCCLCCILGQSWADYIRVRRSVVKVTTWLNDVKRWQNIYTEWNAAFLV